MDPNVLKSNYNVTWRDVWSKHCKFYELHEGLQRNCMPCLLFNPLNDWIMQDVENVSNT